MYYLFNSSMVCFQRNRTCEVLNLLSVPKSISMNGGTFDTSGCAITMYTAVDLFFCMFIRISSASRAKLEKAMGMPVLDSMGRTIPTIWFVCGSNSILETIEVASSDNHTRNGSFKISK